jgi:uncharacterized protein YkwD
MHLSLRKDLLRRAGRVVGLSAAGSALAVIALTGFGSTSSAQPASTTKLTAVKVRTANASVDSVQAQAEAITDRPRVLRELRRINNERVRAGLRPVRLSLCLQTKVAQPWARNMARTGTFEHQDLSVVAANCPRFGWAGENIAYGYRTTREVMVGWMNSDGHRANILKPEYTHVGLGIKRDASGTRHWVQDFGG